MNKILSLAVLAGLGAGMAGASVIYRETFPHYGGWTKAGAWESTLTSTRNGLATNQGWFGYSNKAGSSSGTIQPFGNPWGLTGQAATWVTGPRANSGAMPVSPGETNITQVNSTGIAIGSANPTSLTLAVGQGYGDTQLAYGSATTDPVPSALGWSPLNVYDAMVFTQEYQFNLATVSKMQVEVTTWNNSNYRFLIHFGNDFDQEFPGGATQSGSLGTGWYASDPFAVAGSGTVNANAVWTTQALNVLPSTNWYSVTSAVDYSNGMMVSSTASYPTGTVTAFGIYLVGPNGSSRFDNYTIENVPEPVAISLLGLGVLATVRRNRK
jgi:hypothetical protein